MAASQATLILAGEERTEIMSMLPGETSSPPSPPSGPDTERGPMEGVSDKPEA